MTTPETTSPPTASEAAGETPIVDAAEYYAETCYGDDHVRFGDTSWTHMVVKANVARTLERDFTAARKRIEGLEAEIHIVFDGPPSHENGRFIEVEDASGKSINAGRWEQNGEYWHLIIEGKK